MGGGGERERELRRDGKDGRPLARARVLLCTGCPRDEVRGIAEGEKLRFTDRRTLTKREWSLRERRKLVGGGRGRSGYKRRFPAFSFLHVSFTARLISSSFSFFKIERIIDTRGKGKMERMARERMKTKVNSFKHNR